jgi:hypothetical protein
MPDEKELAYWSERFGVSPKELKRTWDLYLAINPPGHMVRAQVSEHPTDRPTIWTMPDWAALAVAGGVLAVAWGVFGATVKPHLGWGLLILLGLVVIAVGIFIGWRGSRR